MSPGTERVIFQQGALAFNNKCYAMLEEAEKTFADGEHALYVTRTNLTVETIGIRKKGIYSGAMVCFTDRRLIARHKSGTSVDAIEVDYRNIRSVSTRKGGSHTSYIDLMDDVKRYEMLMSYDNTEREHFYGLVRDAINAWASSKKASGGSQSSPDVLSQIEKLGELRDKGLLTDAEFEAEKTKLLSRL